MSTRFLKFTSFIFTLAGLISCQSKGQYNTPANNRSLLWEVTGNGLKKPSYLFGTMHLMCAKDALISNNLKTIIANADEIFFEIDMDDISQLLSGFTSGVMKDNTKLTDLYSTEEYQRIRSFFDKHGMGSQLQLLNKMQPMLVSALVYQALLPCTQSDGMEMGIMKLAHTHKKSIKGLESAAFQASVLDKIPYKEQAAELLGSIDSLQHTEDETKKMIQIYKDQDVEKLLEFSLASESIPTAEMQEALIDSRNRNWALQFPQVTKDKGILIAVGAGHLGGTNGLLNLLKQQGYTIRPIEN